MKVLLSSQYDHDPRHFAFQRSMRDWTPAFVVYERSDKIMWAVALVIAALALLALATR